MNQLSILSKGKGSIQTLLFTLVDRLIVLLCQEYADYLIDEKPCFCLHEF
ncbi:hypothetical protein PMIT1313_02340 [Prochlorococcus marinus str. MIT 1313]|nr:hypothetical protein PMIT1313_02340 [Prochlorococcus marinus str. MIT 1313]